jgi:hypothetical protein
MSFALVGVPVSMRAFMLSLGRAFPYTFSSVHTSLIACHVSSRLLISNHALNIFETANLALLNVA